MNYRIALIILSSVIPLLFGCKEELPGMREFPVIETLDVTDIDSTGATFQGKLIQNGTTPTTSYGFVWDFDSPNTEQSHQVILGENMNASIYKVRMDSALAKGLEYSVRTFATYGDKTVYGNTIKFMSKGSTHCAWSLKLADVPLKGGMHSYGCSNNQLGYIIFQSADTYQYNPEVNKITVANKFPHRGGSLSRFTSVAIEDVQYVFSDIDRYMYKLANGVWTEEAQTPFSYSYFGGYYHGYAISNNIYLLSTTQSYRYNVNTNTWESKAKLQMDEAGWSVGGADLNGKAYLITTNKNIWEYNADSNTWVKKTRYPGVLYDKIVAFSYQGKLYFGLSYHDHYETNNWFDRHLWIYDPTLDKWETTQKFPMDLVSGDLFYFFLKNNLYLGYTNNGRYSIWKFDPTIN